MLGRVMELWTSEALQRVADTPPERWAPGSWSTCLVGHAVGYADLPWSCLISKLIDEMGPSTWDKYGRLGGFVNILPGNTSWSHFDKLYRRHKQRIVRLLQDRARRILAKRLIAEMPRHEVQILTIETVVRR